MIWSSDHFFFFFGDFFPINIGHPLLKKMSVPTLCMRSVLHIWGSYCHVLHPSIHKVFRTIRSSQIKSQDPFFTVHHRPRWKKGSYHLPSPWKNPFFTSSKAHRSKIRWDRPFFPALLLSLSLSLFIWIYLRSEIVPRTFSVHTNHSPLKKSVPNYVSRRTLHVRIRLSYTRLHKVFGTIPSSQIKSPDPFFSPYVIILVIFSVVTRQPFYDDWCREKPRIEASAGSWERRRSSVCMRLVLSRARTAFTHSVSER